MTSLTSALVFPESLPPTILATLLIDTASLFTALDSTQDQTSGKPLVTTALSVFENCLIQLRFIQFASSAEKGGLLRLLNANTIRRSFHLDHIAQSRLDMNIELKDLSAGPVYAQVREQIEHQINEKNVTAGETLPSPAVLAQKLSVDKGEIQRAYFELERAGLVTKETGKDFLGQTKTTYRVT